MQSEINGAGVTNVGPIRMPLNGSRRAMPRGILLVSIPTSNGTKRHAKHTSPRQDMNKKFIIAGMALGLGLTACKSDNMEKIEEAPSIEAPKAQPVSFKIEGMT
ncbi:MAG: hypothetical protein ACI841_003741 [Planctomycetota bacterium]|jgi:hypothetical protein